MKKNVRMLDFTPYDPVNPQIARPLRLELSDLETGASEVYRVTGFVRDVELPDDFFEPSNLARLTPDSISAWLEILEKP